MNQTDIQAWLHHYIQEIKTQFYSGHAKEHAYRPALERLMSNFDDCLAVNDPKRSENGNPDFVFLKRSNHTIILGYAEAKDVDVSLDKTERTEQMERYSGYANLFLTNYLEFRFFLNGDKYQTISLGEVKNNILYLNDDPAAIVMLADELASFIAQPPEKIRSGKRLAEIMGGRARRIRDNVKVYLTEDTNQTGELARMYQMMTKMLVHDLTEEKFADMYAQTLVYGLFVARYGDDTPEDFSRSEARDLMPKSNPFLRHFFDHIAGQSFDPRLGYIVDELAQIFSVSPVQEIVHKHLRIADTTSDAKDPIIHFYEDFLHEYDPAERKRMGAYYTPIPVVKFIIRQVDKILKEEFGIAKGLASSETFTCKVDTGQEHRVRNEKTGRLEKTTSVNKDFYRVQILDPAVGTATFLNETIKYIHEEFKDQEGRWPAYVQDNLIKRLHGFELMMAPYTIAHLKLGMTLKETGVDKLNDRLGVYLTNTLEEGIPQQPDLFSFGLAEAVSDESRHAAEIKSERPIMVVMGNPPYSVSSNNKSKWIQNLIADYKKDLNERKINLDDDYIKFIRFAEEMIESNGEGVVAMITNNSYIDGITHRQMRKHLLETFDKIYVLDLHGNSKKKEVSPDGSKDENVFDIMQGVSIVFMVKSREKQMNELGQVYFSELFGKRKVKFDKLMSDSSEFTQISPIEPYYFFTPKNNESITEYDSKISINDLFIEKSSGFRSGADSTQICWSSEEIRTVVHNLIILAEEDFRNEYSLKDGRNHNYTGMKNDVGDHIDDNRIISILYRPFDIRSTYYSKRSSGFAARPRNRTMKNFLNGSTNIGLVFTRMNRQFSTGYFYVTNYVTDEHILDNGLDSNVIAPLYIQEDDDTRTANFNQAELSALLRNLQPYCYVDSEEDLFAPVDDIVITAVDVLDYIYAVLHSPKYRETYKEFLKIDFPRIPAPVDISEFSRLVELGGELRQLHLMKSPAIDNYKTTFPEQGSNEVEKLSYEGNKVYINSTQYFGNVPETAWNFYIGGYQPAQKWLKDRKNRRLTSEDLDHYQRIIKILLETDRLMKEIDKE